MRILNFGSINVDWVHRVECIAEPGQTIAASVCEQGPGGKGANQSMALARAGAAVWHAGCVGLDGQWLIDLLEAEGIDTSLIRMDKNLPTGHAMIQVDDQGQNAIVASQNANGAISDDAIVEAMDCFDPGDWLLVQNETNAIADIVQAGKQRGMRVAINPAPVNTDIERVIAMGLADFLIVNQSEAQALLKASPRQAVDLAVRMAKHHQCDVLLTLGEYGALYVSGETVTRVAADVVDVVDTTAAGDTFIGYFLAGLADQMPLAANLERASRAATLCCQRAGAINAIPRLSLVDALPPVRE